MAIIYATEQAWSNTNKFGLKKNLDEIIDNCKPKSFDDARKLFETRYPYAYKRVSNFRFIAKVETILDINVICILDILKKGDKESNDFNADHSKYGAEKLEPILNKNDLIEFVKNKIEEGIEIPQPKPQLPANLANWLLPFEDLGKHDELILESQDWARKFEQESYRRFWQSYYELVSKATFSDTVEIPIAENKHVYSISDEKGREIWYTRFLLDDPIVKRESILFLLDAFEPKKKDDPKLRISNKYDWVSEFGEIISSIDDIARYAERSYLSLVLTNESLWYQIQTSDATNPSLSAEEIAILTRVRHAPLSEPVLPLFINGRAGSGKSTMLYHLFSDYLHRKSKDSQDGDLLFLTYSDGLLKTAKESVRKLLRTRADINLDADADIEFSLSDYNNYFWSFLEFVRKQVNSEVLVERFANEKYADFSVFKRLLGKQVLANKLSPGVCWHVIRTFIKGYSSSGELKPEEYSEIPAKERSVSEETYKEIYDKVWPKYKESSYWDTQDLVRYVLTESGIKPNYSVVFCDEAQDFTRLELEFILKLLIFQEYDLGYVKYARLPFALAGDPFQTLNPTGFRWEAIKASFYDEIIGSLDPTGRGNVEFDYSELSYNYRSLTPIVRLSNLLQLWREVLFDVDVVPQKLWRTEYIIPPRLYTLNENITEDEFFEKAKNSVVILPCEQGQEQTFVENDPLLLRLSKQKDYPTFQSPMTAKGLEYTRVILYGFGDACPEKFFEKAKFETQLENEYFLNKLYVAVTRAMKSLIIIDTSSGKIKLWLNAMEDAKIKDFQQRSKSPKKWQDGSVGGVTPGEIYDKGVDEKQDPLEIARKLEDAGQNNSELLRQAMDFYKRSGEEVAAKRCDAKALEADEKYLQAGKLFETIGMKDATERCYWKGHHWPELNIWYATNKGGDDVHHQVVVFMASDGENLDAANKFISFIDIRSKDKLILPFGEVQFQLGVKRATERIINAKDITFSDLHLLTLVDVFDTLPAMKRIVGLGTTAILYSLVERYDIAVDLWEQTDKPSSRLYYIAKSKCVDEVKDKLLLLNKASDFFSIVSIYEETNRAIIDQTTLKIVANAYRHTEPKLAAVDVFWQLGEYGDALSWLQKVEEYQGKDFVLADFVREKYSDLLKTGEFEFALDWLKTIEKNISIEQKVSYLQDYVSALIEKEKWSDALDYVTSKKKGYRLQDVELLRVQSVVIRRLAYVQKTVNLTINIKSAFTDFIQRVCKQGFDIWNKYIDLEIMGAAIEKVGRHIDALSFYSELLKIDLSLHQKKFIRERWLKVTAKQIIFFETQIQESSGPKRDDLADARKNRNRELDDRMRSWGFTKEQIKDLPEYPVIQETKFDIEWTSPNCKISHKEALVMIDVRDGTCVGFKVDPKKVIDDNGIKFFIEEWGLNGTVVKGEKLMLSVHGQQIKEFLVN